VSFAFRLQAFSFCLFFLYNLNHLDGGLFHQGMVRHGRTLRFFHQGMVRLLPFAFRLLPFSFRLSAFSFHLFPAENSTSPPHLAIHNLNHLIGDLFHQGIMRCDQDRDPLVIHQAAEKRKDLLGCSRIQFTGRFIR